MAKKPFSASLDLSALDDPTPTATAVSGGKPLELLLADIEEDPNQPRKEFIPEAMQEMTDSIRARGVKTPVSVRNHPDKPGKWMLNYGARRYRASLAAGRLTIPAFVDEMHDDYDQVVENIQRDDLKPMELALFIQKRLDQGDQKKDIATNLGKDGAVITQHLALIDPPACIEDAYSKGKCRSPKTLYELRGLFEKFPEQVEAWCEGTTDITRKMVADLADELKGKKKPDSKKESGDNDQSNASKSGGSQIPEGDKNQSGDGKKKPDSEKEGGKEGGDNDQIDGARDTGELTSWPKGHAISDPDRMSKPLLLVEYDGRLAAVLLNRRPSSPGLIYVRFEDGGGDREVDAGACKINLLTEATGK